jgi:hypothetical protein
MTGAINTISFISAPATTRELTRCQAKNARSKSTPLASFQLQLHERTYTLSSHESQEQINTISFIPAPAAMRELTPCPPMNPRGRSTPSASFQLQLP